MRALILCGLIGCAPAVVAATVTPPAVPTTEESEVEPVRDVSAELASALAEIDRGQMRAAANDLFAIVCPGKPPIFTAAGFAQCPKTRSSDIGAAWVALGKLAFESQIDRSALGAGAGGTEDAAMAEVAFKRALTSPGRIDSTTIRYRLAWSQYRQDHFSDALGGFLEVLENGKTDLHDEALEYAAVCIHETNGRVPKHVPYETELRARLDAMHDDP